MDSDTAGHCSVGPFMQKSKTFSRVRWVSNFVHMNGPPSWIRGGGLVLESRPVPQLKRAPPETMSGT